MTYDLTAIFLSVKLAAVTTVILFVLGVPLAYWLAYSKRRSRLFIDVLVSMPLVLPPTVLGFYILLIFSPQNFVGHFLETYFNIRVVFTFLGLVVGSVIFSLPFMVNPIKAGFQGLPVSLIEASYTLGKSKWQTLIKVLLPNIKPSLLTAMAMSFAHTMGEFGVVLMVGGSIPGVTRVASIAIYGEVEALNYQTAHVYSLILILVSFTTLLTLNLMVRRASLAHHWFEASNPSTIAQDSTLSDSRMGRTTLKRVPPKAGRVEGPHGSEEENSAAVKPCMNPGSFDRRSHNKIDRGHGC